MRGPGATPRAVDAVKWVSRSGGIAPPRPLSLRRFGRHLRPEAACGDIQEAPAVRPADVHPTAGREGEGVPGDRIRRCCTNGQVVGRASGKTPSRRDAGPSATSMTRRPLLIVLSLPRRRRLRTGAAACRQIAASPLSQVTRTSTRSPSARAAAARGRLAHGRLPCSTRQVMRELIVMSRPNGNERGHSEGILLYLVFKGVVADRGSSPRVFRRILPAVTTSGTVEPTQRLIRV